MEVPKGESVYLVINGESPVKSSAVSAEESVANPDHTESAETSSVESPKTESSGIPHESFLRRLLDRLFGHSNSAEADASSTTAPTSTTAPAPETTTAAPKKTTTSRPTQTSAVKTETPSTSASNGKRVAVIEWPGLKNITKGAN